MVSHAMRRGARTRGGRMTMTREQAFRLAYQLAALPRHRTPRGVTPFRLLTVTKVAALAGWR